MSERVKEVAIEEAEKVKALTVQATRSGAYFYPVRVSTSVSLFSERRSIE